MSLTPHPIRLPDGTTFAVCLTAGGDDPVADALRAGQYPHQENWPLYEGFLRPGAVVVDLGVHVGTFALAAAARGCRVLAVEANPRNVEQVRASIAANRFTALDLIHRAVGDGPGEVTFLCHGPYGHVASGPAGGDLVRVPAVALDTLLADAGVGRVDFVKMDIEGSEVAAVGGMAGLLTGAAPPPVFYESNAHCLRLFGQTPHALRAAFARHGYVSHRLDYARRVLTPVGDGECQPECVIDYLALTGGAALPPGLAGWAVGPAGTAAELVARFRREATYSTAAALVEHLTRELAAAPAGVRDDPAVAAFAARHPA